MILGEIPLANVPLVSAPVARLTRAPDGRLRVSLVDAATGHEFEGVEVEGSYRSHLPKEGAYDVGEGQYEGMVSQERVRAKKALEQSMKPYQDHIAQMRVSVEEKSWVDILITLK